jgi:PAS domain S-box-containing protein
MPKRPRQAGARQTGKPLPDIEERFQLLVDNVRDYAVFMTDATGTIVSWNVGVDRLLGYAEDEFIGQPLTIIFVPEDIASGAAAREVATATQAGRSEDERWHLRKDGSRFWASGVLTALRDEPGRLRGFAKIMRDITERKLAEEERKQLLQREQQARKEAETATRVRDQFLAMVSHELRTPLNAILGWARLLEEQQFEPDRMRRALETISRNAVLQSKLIDDLMDVSRILAGSLTLEQRPVELTPIVQSSVDSLSPEARAKNVTIECRFHPTEVAVAGDPRRLHQVLWNLLSNAIKFTPPGGHVSIELRQDDSTAFLSVSDTGLGIAREFLPHIFEPFSQADMTTQREYGGLGLGLAIVRHLVQQHGGTISAESDGDGKGATFTVELPLSAVRMEPTVGGLLPTDFKPALNGVRVLVVDDDPDGRELLRTTLELAGASVTDTGTTAEAFELLTGTATPPHVVVCDIGLPREDGFMFIKRLRTLAVEAGGGIPAAALTAYTRPEDRLRALEAGYQIHLAKPIEPSELVAAVATLAGRVSDTGGGP